MKYLSILFIILIACDPVKEQYIQPELIDHYNQFYIEAELRGVNVPEKDIILEISDMGEKPNGVSEWGLKWTHIKINKNYLDYFKGKEGEYFHVERLVFHEMGHGILGRRHNNDSRDSLVFTGSIYGTDTLTHSWITIDIPLSVMHSGDEGYGRVGPYYEQNRDYYLDELFK